jgi:hypothetical protein
VRSDFACVRSGCRCRMNLFGRVARTTIVYVHRALRSASIKKQSHPLWEAQYRVLYRTAQHDDFAAVLGSQGRFLSGRTGPAQAFGETVAWLVRWSLGYMLMMPSWALFTGDFSKPSFACSEGTDHRLQSFRPNLSFAPIRDRRTNQAQVSPR